MLAPRDSVIVGRRLTARTSCNLPPCSRPAASQRRVKLRVIVRCFPQCGGTAGDIFAPLANGGADGSDAGIFLDQRSFGAAQRFAHDLADVLVAARADLAVHEAAQTAGAG